jgi:hypothetical protein
VLGEALYDLALYDVLRDFANIPLCLRVCLQGQALGTTYNPSSKLGGELSCILERTLILTSVSSP